MKIVSFFAGMVAGLTVAGIAFALGTTLGLPTGPGWLIPCVPFVLGMGYLAAISD